MKCQFDPAWTNCKKEASTNSEYCCEHQNRKCGVCGEQANRECDATYSLVCGFPLCRNCIEYNSPTNHWHGPKCSWNGYYFSCNAQAIKGKKTCVQHSGKKCICGKDAIKECSNSTGQFACGQPLCEDCPNCTYSTGHTYIDLEKELDEAMTYHRRQNEIRRQQKQNCK